MNDSAVNHRFFLDTMIQELTRGRDTLVLVERLDKERERAEREHGAAHRQLLTLQQEADTLEKKIAQLRAEEKSLDQKILEKRDLFNRLAKKAA